MAVYEGMFPPPDRIVVMFDWPEFVNRLREQYMRCSQERMARILEVCTKSVSNWERGRVKPQWRHCRRLFHLAVKHGFKRELWPAKSWVHRWCDDRPPRYLRTRSIRRKYSRRKTDRDPLEPYRSLTSSSSEPLGGRRMRTSTGARRKPR